MRRSRAPYRELTWDEEDKIVRLTEEGASACYIAEKLGFDKQRIARERQRLGVRGSYVNSQQSQACEYVRKLRPKHVKARCHSLRWFAECDDAFSAAMTKHLSEYWLEKARQNPKLCGRLVLAEAAE